MAYAQINHTAAEINEILDAAVTTATQTIDPEKQAQARANIGAASAEEVGNISTILDTINGEII